jgi:hypothetical protein
VILSRPLSELDAPSTSSAVLFSEFAGLVAALARKIAWGNRVLENKGKPVDKKAR